MLLPVKRVWTRQPDTVCGPDLANPLNRGLIQLYDFRHRNPQPTAVQGATNFVAKGWGLGRAFDSAVSAQWDGSQRSKIANQVTWFLVHDVSVTSSSFIFGDVNPNGATYNSGLYVSASGTPVMFVFAGGVGVSTIGTTTLANRGLCVQVGTYDGTTVRMYLDGKLEGSAAASGAVGQAALEVSLNRWNGAGGQTGNAYLGGWYNRAWSAREVAEFARNWSQVQRRRPAFALTPSAVTIYRPGSDISVAGWIGTPGSPLYANIDESAAADGDYITSPAITGTPQPAVFGLLSAPLAAGSYDIDIRANVASGAANMRVRLYDNAGSEVGASALQAVTTTLTTYGVSITTTGTAYRVGVEFTA